MFVPKAINIEFLTHNFTEAKQLCAAENGKIPDIFSQHCLYDAMTKIISSYSDFASKNHGPILTVFGKPHWMSHGGGQTLWDWESPGGDWLMPVICSSKCK